MIEMSGGVSYLQGFAVSFRWHDATVFSLSERQSTQIQTLRTTEENMDVMSCDSSGSDLSWHFTLRSQDSQSCTLKKRKRRTRRSFMLLIKPGAFDIKKRKRGFRKRRAVGWNSEEEVTTLLKSRCPNRFPRHFLLSTPRQRFKAFFAARKKDVCLKRRLTWQNTHTHTQQRPV